MTPTRSFFAIMVACCSMAGSLRAADVIVIDGGVVTVTGVAPVAPTTTEVKMGAGQIRAGGAVTAQNVTVTRTTQATGGQVVRGDDARLSNARAANGGNADTVDGKHAADFVPILQKGVPFGVATLDENGKVPPAQIPDGNGGGGGGGGTLVPVSVTGNITLDGSAIGKLHLISGTSVFEMVLPSASLYPGGTIGFSVAKWESANKFYRVRSVISGQGDAFGNLLTLIHTNYVELIATNGQWIPRVKNLDTQWIRSDEVVITAETTNPTKAGTRPLERMNWRRCGGDLLIEWQYIQNAGGIAGSGVYRLPFPAAMPMAAPWYYKVPISSLAVPQASGLNWQAHCVGYGSIGNDSQLNMAMIYLHDIFNFSVVMISDTSKAVWSSSSSLNLANAVRFSGSARVPIDGW